MTKKQPDPTRRHIGDALGLTDALRKLPKLRGAAAQTLDKTTDSYTPVETPFGAQFVEALGQFIDAKLAYADYGLDPAPVEEAAQRLRTLLDKVRHD